ncbi:Uma2 family endonuclease [Sphingomonas sp. BK580]|uniref:Uma2 family endonuclease n=1 Tax=Sphingomonas sp. BK580 TaxID=2586972 RepID=UPI00160BD33A|nr:Uma2 family endonuclease [Sphingomonas sp. BK580]MBB3695352.1 Uma2 family endonuclease [Sphingomonas sp. BK580]
MTAPITPLYPSLTAERFLAIDFGEEKAELDRGVVRIITGATKRHVEVAGNVLTYLATSLRGSGFAAYSSQLATRTGDLSVRQSDVAVFHGKSDPSYDNERAFTDPRVLFEVLSGSTARTDLTVKLEEYRALPSVDTIVFVDIAAERLRVLQRNGPRAWSDVAHDVPVDVALPALRLTLPHAEIFARD